MIVTLHLRFELTPTLGMMAATSPELEMPEKTPLRRLNDPLS
jgi:hypothetical protein